jgi:hypothetical protein
MRVGVGKLVTPSLTSGGVEAMYLRERLTRGTVTTGCPSFSFGEEQSA